MNDQELADRVVTLDAAKELRQVLMVSGAVQNDDHSFVRDWRVVGALTGRCADNSWTVEILRDHEGDYWCAIDDMLERPPGPTILGECTDNSLPRAIISACVQALEAE